MQSLDEDSRNAINNAFELKREPRDVIEFLNVLMMKWCSGYIIQCPRDLSYQLFIVDNNLKILSIVINDNRKKTGSSWKKELEI
jgi:hypothetical protein